MAQHHKPGSKKKKFRIFKRDANDPLEFGYRGIGLLDLSYSQGSLNFAVTRLSVS